MDREPPETQLLDFEPAQVFEILGNETRIEILRALWESYDPFSDANGLAFSELFDEVGIADSGQFNYHLDKLREIYVTQTAERYRLTTVGLRLVQSVIAGAGQELAYETAEVDTDCRLCGAPIELTYDGQRVFFVCTECEGNFQAADYPEGTLWGESIPPAGVVNRTPEELFATVSFLDWPHKAMLTAKICPQCTGVLELSIEICEAHEASGDRPCPECGYTDPIQANWLCTVCKYHGAGSPIDYVKNHPAVIAFRYEHDIDFGYPYTASDFDSTKEEEAIRRRMDWDLELVSKDPPTMRATVSYGDDSIELMLDEELAVSVVDSPTD